MPLRIHFKSKYSGKGWEKEKIKKLSFRFVPTQCVIENSKKITKKFKKLKNTNMASL